MEVENKNEPVDIFNMSEDDFKNFTENSTDPISNNNESASADSINGLEETGNVDADDEYIDVEGADDEIIEDSNTDTSESDSELHNDNESETTTENNEIEFDADDAFKKLFSEPIKANGREYKIESKEDAIKLIQMGMGYYRNMEALKPKRNLLAMLDNHQIDEDKLNFAIDLLNKNPQAINKLISDLDLSEIIDESNANYTPNNYKVDERTLNVREALSQIENSPAYTRTVNILGKEWDETSRKIVQENTHLIGTINSHIENGMFDAIIAEVDKRMMLGSIPYGTPMLHAYKMVGDEMYAKGNNNTAPNNGQQFSNSQANARPPIRKPSEQIRQNKMSASKPRSTANHNKTQQFEDVFKMTDAEFNRKYGNN